MNQKPIIVLVIQSLAGRGGERSVLTLAKGFSQIGCEVHLVCFSDHREYDLPDYLTYHVINVSSPKYKILPRENRYQWFAKKFDKYITAKIGSPDLILSNLIQQNRILSHSKLDNIAYIIRNTFSIEYKAAIAKNPKKILNRFRSIYQKHPCICVSKGVERDLIETLGDIRETTTIYNAFDQQEMLDLAKEYEPQFKDCIVHVGTFSHAKAHDVLLKAYASSNQKLPLVLLGKGKLESNMKQLASDLNIEDKVHFLGFNKNPYPYIKNATALVLSSNFEGFVRVVVEALALGVPAISTDCKSGPNEILPENNLVNVGDVEALSEKMSQVMCDPERFKVGFDESLLPENIARQYLDYFSITVP